MSGPLYRDPDGTLPAYAWPGGYPMYYLTRDGNVVCPRCANDPGPSDPVIAGDVHWEGQPLICEDNGEVIDSAYGDPEDYIAPWVSTRREP